jgi:SAM-dependent methyltransferase
MATATVKLVQLGCGPSTRPGHWLDYDGSWNARLNHWPAFMRAALRAIYGFSGRPALVFPSHVKYLNLQRVLPFPDASVDGIYASHVWEHLYYDDARLATRECWRVLKPGGILRLVVPNLRWYCEQYLAAIGSETAAADLHRNLLYRHLRREKSWLLQAYTALTDFHSHKFMYDEAALEGLLKASGFGDARLRAYLETDLPHLEEVEEEGRLLHGAGFAIEARRT